MQATIKDGAPLGHQGRGRRPPAFRAAISRRFCKSRAPRGGRLRGMLRVVFRTLEPSGFFDRRSAGRTGGLLWRAARRRSSESSSLRGRDLLGRTSLETAGGAQPALGALVYQLSKGTLMLVGFEGDFATSRRSPKAHPTRRAAARAACYEHAYEPLLSAGRPGCGRSDGYVSCRV